MSDLERSGHRPDRLRPCDEVRCHSAAPHVEVAVLEAEALVDIGTIVKLERKRRRWTQHRQVRRNDLDLPRREIRVHGSLGSGCHIADHLDAVLGPQAVEHVLASRLVLRIQDDLDDP